MQHNPRLNLLGRTAFYVGESQIGLGAKHLALLAYLVVEGSLRSREGIVELLWPRSSTRSGLHSLSQALYSIKRKAGEAVFNATGSTLLGVQIESDYRDFMDAVAAADWSTAASHVQGYLCDDLKEISAPFDHWLDAQRATFRIQVRNVLPHLELGFEWSHLLRTTRLVRDQFGADPECQRFEEVAITALESHRENEPAMAIPSTRKFPFVGRTSELSSLSAVQRRIERSPGKATALIVTGPPGVGKSALCDRFARLSALRGWSVVQGVGYSAESNLPLGVLAQFLSAEDISDAVSTLPPSLNATITNVFPFLDANADSRLLKMAAEPDVHRIRLFESIRRTLIAVANERPLLLVLDDSQWSDPSSKAFLHHLFWRALPHGLLILFASNAEESRRLERQYEIFNTITLTNLGRDETKALLSHAALEGHRQTVSSLHSRTGGNPLLMKAVLSSDLSGDDGVQVASSAAEFFRLRFEQLGDDSKLVFAAVTVLGGSASTQAILNVSLVSPESLPRCLLELTAEDLVQSGDDIISVTHGLAGEVLLAELTPVVKRLLYARAARHRRDNEHSPPAVVAVQLDIAGESKEAFEAAVQAASGSVKLSANREAEYFLRLALSHAGDDNDIAFVRLEIAKLFLKLGRAHEIPGVLDWDGWARCGEDCVLWKEAYETTVRLMQPKGVESGLAEAWKLAEQALLSSQPAVAAHLLMKIASATSDNGRLNDTRRAAHQLVTILPLLAPPDAVRCRGAAAAAICLAESVVKARGLLEDLYLDAHHPQDRIQYLGAKALVDFAAGRLREAETNNLSAVALCEEHGHYSLYAKILNNLSVCYLEMGRYAEAKECIDRVLDFTSGGASSKSQALIAYDNLSLVAYEERAFDRCLEVLEIGAELNRRVQSKRSMVAALGIRGLANLQLGRLPEAFACERQLKQIDGDRTLLLFDLSHVELFAARMDMLRGDDSTACARLSEAISAYQDRDPYGRARLQLEVLRLRRNRPSEIERQALELERELERSGAQPLLADLREILGRIP